MTSTTRSALGAAGAAVRAAERRARVAQALAERVFDPIEPLREGAAYAEAAALYLQSAYWSVTALYHDGEAVELAQAWQSGEAIARWALPDDASLAAVEALFVGTAFRTLGLLGEAEQAQRALAARTLARALLERLERPERAARTRTARRVLLAGVASVLVVVLFFVARHFVVATGRGPDLLAGRPFRQSSVWAECDVAAKRCGSLRTRVFFHTKEDANPWVEYDLGQPTQFSQIEVKNRTDEVPDRAIPLVVEVSDNRQAWKKLARRDESFRTWTTTFAAQRARYLRLRVDRKSYLHLERVMLFR